MTESGFPPLPPRGQTPPPAPSGAGSEEGLRVQLIGMPSSIRTIERPVRIEGEIGRPNSDGSVRVRTAQGDIDIRPEPGRSPPREGTRVELELKPGTPPNRGTLYVAGTAVPSDANQPAPDVRSRETPVKVTVDGSSKTETPRPVPDAYSSSVRVDSAAPVPPPLFPASGALVRLDPLTLEQAQEIHARFSSESLAQAGITASPLPPEFLRAFPIESLPAKAPVPSSTATTAAPVEISSGKLAPDSSSFPVLPQQEELALIEDFLDRILGSAKTPESDFSPILESQKAEFSPAAAPFMARIEEALPPPNADPRNASPHDAKNPGAQKSEMSPEPAAPQNLSALTTGLTTAEGFPVLSVTNSQGGLVSFYIARSPGAEIAPGTLLRLTPLNAQEIIGTPSTALPLLTPGIWPAMTALYETLAQIAPPLAHTLRAGISNPASPTQITPAALFFMAAVTGGNLAGWLGDKTIDALRRDGRGHILSRLMEESGLMGRLTATESTGQDWRSMALPLFWDNEIHKMILHYKRDGQEDDTPEKGKQGTRFIFDLTLSAMGKIQIDGLFRSNRLDVILRSLTPFSAAMQADMRRTYVLALEETGLTGELGFQSDPSKWVTVTAEAEPFWVSA